jgi:hypothetical protein
MKHKQHEAACHHMCHQALHNQHTTLESACEYTEKFLAAQPCRSISESIVGAMQCCNDDSPLFQGNLWVMSI